MNYHLENDIDALARRVRRVQDTVNEVVAIGTTPGQEVTCRVDATGRLRGLEIAERALYLGARRLAELVRQAHADAIAEVERAAAELRHELTNDPAVAHLADLLSGDAGRPETFDGAGRRDHFLEDPMGSFDEVADRREYVHNRVGRQQMFR